VKFKPVLTFAFTALAFFALANEARAIKIKVDVDICKGSCAKVKREVKRALRKLEPPMHNYCAKWRDSSQALSVHRATFHSRLGADSIRAQLALKVGDANIVYVKGGACSSRPND
jgi:hypothetical protein